MSEAVEQPGSEQLVQFDVLISSDISYGIVSLRGELDLVTIPRLERTLDQLCRNGCRQILLDLSQLTFISATGIGVLVAANQVLQEAGGRLVLSQPSHRVRRLLAITGEDAALAIE